MKKQLNDQEIETLLAQYDSKTLDTMFRTLWTKYIKDDIENHAKDLDIELSNDQIQTLAEQYVFDGEYDANLSHWSNIENLIYNNYQNN